MYKRILIATDGSALSAKAVNHGLELAALAFCDLAQCRQHVGRGLGGKFLADGSGHRPLHHDLS